MSRTENIPNRLRDIPSLDKVSTKKSGPLIAKIRRNAILIYIAMCIVAVLPYILTKLGVFTFSVGVQAAALGLFFPGAGLIATGSLWAIAVGIFMFWIVKNLGMTIWGMPAVVLIIIYFWLLSILGGAFIKPVFINNGITEVPWYCLVIIVAIVLYTIIYQSNFADKRYQRYLEKRRAHETYGAEEMKKLNERIVEPQPRELRELDEAAVKASRYLFDMSLREPGDFSGYESVDQVITSALRYTLDFLGYSLALMQNAYMPNFHGYLNKAEQFIIESFTHPAVCEYWKWEYLSSLRWNPDPIKNLNIMFSGWSGLVVTLYGANTGDLRYEQPGALKFKPFFNSNKTYDYSSKDIVEILVKNWKKYRTNVFPCEPHLTFPQCNTFAMDCVLAYDRQHNTTYLEDIFPILEKRLNENFILPSGDIAFVHNTLLGFRSLDNHPEVGDTANLFITARIMNAVMPGLAKVNYLYSLKDYVDFKDGEFLIYGDKSEKMVDFGNLKIGPAYYLGLLAAVAAEFGDQQTVKQVLDFADRHFEKLDNPNIYAYKKASVNGNAHMAAARFSQKDDFYNMIHKGPGEGALRGPLLTDCKYPNVMVAHAMSDGDDLDLVLYNGEEPGVESITIERLKPGKPYNIKDSKVTFTADSGGKAVIDVNLNGRTKVHIVPA